ncbi:trypsin-like serine peptidase [Bdellovibrio sp. HCB337]|uniref:trypsin-like serine peptidase n=1 Tax=Bdellovibrio sp. HCB337 TaxID=3394358 RepID=UPI0039A5C3BF
MKISFLLPLLALLSACTSPHNGFEDALVDKDSNPIIWDEDTRTDVSSNDADLDLAKATAVLFHKHRLSEQADGSFQVPSNPLNKIIPLCQYEKFLDQSLLGHCSGVLLGPSILLTAGHCVKDKKDCDDIYITFGRTEEKAKSGSIPKAEVYTCKRILKSVTGYAKDYALVELDRSVTQAEPVKIGDANELNEKDSIISLSYPLGLPLKKDSGEIIRNDLMLNFFTAKIDTFGGSSGSPLFNQKKELVGILSTGTDDFLDDAEGFQRHFKNGTCIQAKRCTGEMCFGERFMKTSIIGL